MSSKIATVEDTLIAKCKAIFGATLRTVEYAPSDWDDDYIKRVLVQLPGVFIVFGGGATIRQSVHATMLDSRWGFVAASRVANQEKARARGDKTTIGCYEIIERVLSVFDGFVIDEVGTLEALEWNNELSMKLQDQGLMVQSVNFRMPISIEASTDGGNITPFETFHDTIDIGQKAGAPPAEDFVELEQ